MSEHDELITMRMPIWAWQAITNGLEKWAGRHWYELEITEPVEFTDVPDSWYIHEEDGGRYLLMKRDTP